MSIFFLVIFIILIFLLLLIFPSNKSPSDLTPPYLSKNPLSPTETIFYHRLKSALPDCIILAQVQLSSFIKVDRKRNTKGDYYRWFNPISQQSVDYLICSNDFSIIAAIELDDKSHVGDASIARDLKKTNNIASAKIPLVRWHVEAMPEVEAIKLALSRYMPSSQNPSQNEVLCEQDEPPNFLKYKKKENSLIPVIVIVSLAFVGLLFFNYLFSPPKFIQKSQTTQLEAVHRLREQLKKQDPNIVISGRQQEEKSLHGNEKQQAQLVQQPERLAIISEDQKKEDLWNSSFKDRVKCTNEDGILKCDNENIRNRKEFEIYWETHKDKLL